jgi:hypothetical protein
VTFARNANGAVDEVGRAAAFGHCRPGGLIAPHRDR